MKPYYEDGSVTIYHGDAREILPEIDPVDLVLTDPPYGIAHLWTKGSEKHGWGKANGEAALRNQWDDGIPDDDLMALVVGAGRDAIVWGGNYFHLPSSRCWLVWNKPERGFSLAEAELAWTTRDAVVRVKDLPRSEPDREHPTQKPLALFSWCIDFFPDAGTILDPFMGSGTTLRAAKNLNRKAIGIEREERYCEIAAERCSQEVLDLAA